MEVVPVPITEAVGVRCMRGLWCFFFLCGDFIRSSFLFWRSYFLAWRLYSYLDGSVTVLERGNGRFHRSLGHDGGVRGRENTFIVAVGVKGTHGGGIRRGEGCVGEGSYFVLGDGSVIEEGDIMLAGSVGVEIIIFTVVSEKKGIISLGRDFVERKGDAGTLFKEEALVFEERLALLFGEKGDLVDDFSWHGKGSPLVSLEFVAGVQV